MSYPLGLEIYNENRRQVRETQIRDGNFWLSFAYYYSRNDKGGGIVDRKIVQMPYLQKELF